MVLYFPPCPELCFGLLSLSISQQQVFLGCSHGSASQQVGAGPAIWLKSCHDMNLCSHLHLHIVLQPAPPAIDKPGGSPVWHHKCYKSILTESMASDIVSNLFSSWYSSYPSTRVSRPFAKSWSSTASSTGILSGP